MVGMWLAQNGANRLTSLTLCCTSAQMGPASGWAERAAAVRKSGTRAVSEAVVERWFTRRWRAVNPPRVRNYQAMSTMRAMRRLRPEPVPRELIERLIQAASWAPSGGNSQTTRYIVVDDRTQIARIAPLWRRVQGFYVTAQAEACPPTMSPKQWQRTLGASQYLADHFEDVPALIVVCCDMMSRFPA